ncbi:hypothetical protein Trco_002443 [Trichoderma cornu-damae]|uniref:Uncharacterized protein n=1 Tax=Trichoderma cornu-damae TaxID=654480 RepID=A0A9P8TYH1_9HYPO|nr:hypothetical protein Trco_002443 [Trichoderma cornu-damae]
MANSAGFTVVLITGVGRGLAEIYLLRPNHIVIGSVRDRESPNYDELKKLPTAEGSRLFLVSIESSNLDDPKNALKDVESEGITHIDVVIANAGACPFPGPLQTVMIQDVLDAFKVNAASPIQLYQATRPFLEKSARPVWLSVSSVAGSIKNVEENKTHFLLAYGMSKSALDFFTMAVHAAHSNWISYAVHPGLVQTDLGNQGARMQGLEEAPVTLKDSCNSIIASIDKATRAEVSGKFIDLVDNNEIPW